MVTLRRLLRAPSRECHVGEGDPCKVLARGVRRWPVVPKGRVTPDVFVW